MDIHKILVPIDHTPMCQEAITQALKIAKKSKGATITLLHVIDHPASYSTPAMPAGLDETKQYWTKMGEELLHKHFIWLAQRYPHIDMVLLSGDIPNAIAHYADSTEHDLIIMGRRKLTGLQKIFISHISDKVSTLTKIPVMKIHEKSNLVTFPASWKTS